MTLVSIQLPSFLRSIISPNHANGFPSFEQSGCWLIRAVRRVAMQREQPLNIDALHPNVPRGMVSSVQQ